MNEWLVSKRYAKALFEYAAENGEDMRIYENMRVVARSFSSVIRLREALVNPVLGRKDKALLMTHAAGDDTGETYRRFIGLLLDNRREYLLRNIALSYMGIYRRAHGISVVTLVSVRPMSDFLLERIKLDVERRTHGKVELDTRIDPSIDGGFIFQIDDLLLDASVRGQLEKIKQQFIVKNRTIV